MTTAATKPSTVMVPLHRKEFFADVRKAVFNGFLSQAQVDGMNAVLDEWERHFPDGGDLRACGYVLGTTWWETGKTMAPIREIGRGRGHRYGVPDPQTGQRFFGRGFVQLTWRTNYQKLGKLIGVDLVNHPDRALEPKIAAKIIVIGMLLGSFTGRKLGHFFTAKKADWVEARRIVNGTDRAHEIADASLKFCAALTKAKAALPAPPMPPPLTKVQTMTVNLPAPGRIAGVASAVGSVALILGFPQVAALTGLVTPENIEHVQGLITLAQTLFGAGGALAGLAGFLPSHKAA